MLPWLFNVLFAIKVGFCSCSSEVRRLGVARVRSHYRVERLPKLPRVVAESSGLARRTADGRTVWTHNDGGGRPTLYGVDVASGTLLDSLSFPSLRNVDWEDLAQADTARLFIADLGNNANTRQDLSLYEVVLHHRDTGRTEVADAKTNLGAPGISVVNIAYSDQTSFPPRKRNFDCEAVFYRNDSLFLLSKNRSGHQVRLYGLPAPAKAPTKAPAKAGAGTHALVPLDSVFIKSMVTGAALSPDGQTLAVLTYGKILFFRLGGTPLGTLVTLSRPTGCLRLPRGQAEGIVFLNDTDLIISNERGWLYRIRPRR